MKNIMKMNAKNWMLVLLTVVIASCTFEEVVDPNGPSVDGVSSNATIGQLNELVVGVESAARFGLGIETTASGTMGREFIIFDADPRNQTDLLGFQGTALSSSAFYSVAQWNGNYRCIKNANLLIRAANNTSFITDEERNGYVGFAKTIIAYELIQVVKSYDVARVDVADENNLGPVLNKAEALVAIRALLNEANTDLGTSSFIFELSSGFDGFNDPATFRQFNRAIAAMAAVYAEDGSGALTDLNNSFFDLAGDLTVGPKHAFALSGDDQTNDLFKTPSTTVANQNNGDNLIVQNSFITDAEPGDTRVATKTAPRPDPTFGIGSLDDGSFLNGTHETRLYSSSTDPIDIIRNEELILLYAEASILANNLQDAEDALNVIRNAAGLPDYSGLQNAADLTTEMLNQRRYSLWGENHRMFDMRRYGLSDTLPLDRPEDQIFNVFPVPLSENL